MYVSVALSPLNRSISLSACIMSMKLRIQEAADKDKCTVVGRFCIDETKKPYHRLQVEMYEEADKDEPLSVLEKGDTFRARIPERIPVNEFLSFLDEWNHYVCHKAIKSMYMYELSIKEKELSFIPKTIPIEEACQVRQRQSEGEKTPLLLLIDGPNLLNRAFFSTAAIGNLMQRSDGTFTNGVYGFLKMLSSAIKKYNPTHLVICWESPTGTTWRHREYPEYKATRGKKDERLGPQFSLIQRLLDYMGICQVAVDDYEADDGIATMKETWLKESQGNVYILSGDKDLYQCLCPRTAIIADKSGELFTEDTFKEKFGIECKQWIDVKSIMGDTGDNIKGVPRIGEKGALGLISDYSSLENVLDYLDQGILDSKHKRCFKPLEEGREDGLFSKKLVTISADIPLNIGIENTYLSIDKEGMKLGFDELEFDRSKLNF